MSKLYEMYDIKSDAQRIPNMLDVYFCAANSDQRCYNVLSFLSDGRCKIHNITVFDYQKLRPQPHDTNAQCDDNFELLNNNYQAYHRFNTTDIISCSAEDDDVNYIAHMQIETDAQIGIDITGFTIPDVFRIMYILKEIKHIASINVFYTEPQHYVFKQDMFDTYEYLIGERTYKPIPEYFAVGRYEKELLVFFLGFDLYVSDYIYEKALPNEAIAVNGFPAYLPKLKDISLLNNYSLLTAHIDSEHRFYAKAINPFSSYNTLCDIRESYPDYLMNICVLGTKPMALGACLFSLNNKKNVKVTYPYPQKYALHITESQTKSWCYVIDL
jgi:hypothetical protein